MKGLGIGDIGPVALSLTVSIIIVAVAALILAQLRTGSTNVNFTSVVDLGLAAIGSFANWFSIMVVVIVAVIILSLVMLLRGRSGGA
jgi:DNA-binding transcriptional regulator of glucitol operon